MPALLAWTAVANGIIKEDASMLLETFKSFKIAKSQLVPCKICALPSPHNMRRRVLVCASKACKDVEPLARYESSLPALPTVQRFTQHYTRTKLRGSNDYLDIQDQFVELALAPGQLELEPFTFTWEGEADGSPHVGCGSDGDPFIVGITSERLLKSAYRDPNSFVMHADATFKLNQVGYPVFVVGVSDMARSFHLLAVFVTSQRREPDYFKMFSALKNVFYRVIGVHLTVRYAMADADDAQWRATQVAFGENTNFQSLMCYYHITAKVYEKTRGLLPPLAAVVSEGVSDMHFSTSITEFNEVKARVLSNWAKRPELKTFSTYFKQEWLSGRFVNWQAFHTPRGYATTNNPAEQFNRTIKRVYTLHGRLKMGALLTQLCTCCRSESQSAKPFTNVATAPSSLWRRMRELQRAGNLFEWTPPRSSLAFVLDDGDHNTADLSVNVVLRPCQRVLDEETGRKREVILVTAQMSASITRMEYAGMPDDGWKVDIQRRECSCYYFAKYATCVHLLLAISSRGLNDVGTRAKLVYRGPNKARRLLEGAQGAGRPPLNSYALNHK